MKQFNVLLADIKRIKHLLTINHNKLNNNAHLLRDIIWAHRKLKSRATKTSKTHMIASARDHIIYTLTTVVVLRKGNYDCIQDDIRFNVGTRAHTLTQAQNNENYGEASIPSWQY